MATTLEDLIASLSNQQSYTPMTADQIKQTATNRYQSLYDQKRLDAEQQYKTSDTALAQQLAGLQQSYDKQRKSTAEEYQKAASQTDRYSLNRGMQRSSYNNATIANIGIKGAEAQDDINAAQRTAEGNIEEQRALLAQQLAQQKNQLNASQASDIMAYMDELEAREYERTQNDTNLRNQLALQLYQYQFQKDQAAQEQSNWQKQFDAQYGNRGGGGSVPPRDDTTPPANGIDWSFLYPGQSPEVTTTTNPALDNIYAAGNRVASTGTPQNLSPYANQLQTQRERYNRTSRN